MKKYATCFVLIVGVVFGLFQKFSDFELVVIHFLSGVSRVRGWSDNVLSGGGRRRRIIVLLHAFA